MEDDGFISIQEIQKETGDTSRSFVYDSILPLLDVRKVGRKTVATKKSFKEYLRNCPRAVIGRAKDAGCSNTSPSARAA